MASSSSQQPSTANAANTVPTIKLFFSDTDTNYEDWREENIAAIRARNEDYLGFIDGTIGPPPATVAGTTVRNPDFDFWMRADNILRGFLLSSLNDDVCRTVSALQTSCEVWLALENKFRQLFSSAPPARVAGATATERDLIEYLPLHRAALQGDWEAAKRFFDANPGSITTRISPVMGAALHVAVTTGKSINFVEKLVAEIPKERLADLKDKTGGTALSAAAVVGNRAAATILVNRSPDLVYIPNDVGDFPVQTAAIYVQKDMLTYLLDVTKDDYPHANPYGGSAGLKLLLFVIEADFLDIAFSLVVKYPDLARKRLPGPDRTTALLRLCAKTSIFCCESRFNFWERFISSCVSVEALLNPQRTNGCDIESMARCGKTVLESLCGMLQRFVEMLGPIKSIKEKTLQKQEALKLANCLSNEILKLSYTEADALFGDAIIMSAILGNHEVIQVVVEYFPSIMYTVTPEHQHIFHIAVKNRSENVFNLIYQMSDYKHIYSSLRDSDGNNLLHYAGKLGPLHKRDEISGAALQMQREMQWFKEVEKLVDPRSREGFNNARKSPMMVFREEHKSLKDEGEKWMKDTSNSCTIAAALIATVMFAAAITAPGGNDSENGLPIFSSDPAFIIFAISDAISLFTSATSLLMFLAILTARYTEEDFLRVLPKRLIFGLGTLFLSITFMMAAFSAAIYIVFGRRQAWVLIPVGALACLPVTSFVLLQFPLLVDLISSTYGSGIFGKQSDHPFY